MGQPGAQVRLPPSSLKRLPEGATECPLVADSRPMRSAAAAPPRPLEQAERQRQLPWQKAPPRRIIQFSHLKHDQILTEIQAIKFGLERAANTPKILPNKLFATRYIRLCRLGESWKRILQSVVDDLPPFLR